MPLRFAVTLTLVVIGLAGTVAAQERHYLLYLSTATNCAPAQDPANFQSAPGARPLLPPTSFTQNQTLTRQLCMFHWNPAPLTTPPTEVCQPGPSVKGDEVCQQLLQFTTSGFTIQLFTPAAGFQANTTTSSLKLIGGSIAGQVQASLGSITLTGTAAGGIFRLQTGDYVESDATKRTLANVVVGQVASTCGNGVINPPEECDDGNVVSGDACFRTCEIPRFVSFEGAPTGIGAVIGSLEGVQKTVTTAGLSTASDVASALANTFNADPTIVARAVAVDAIDDSIYSGGTFGTFTSSDPGITIPEPGGTLGLVSGVLFLAAIGRRRVHR